MIRYQRASLKWNKGWKISQWITAYLIRTVISYRSQKRRGRQKGTRKGKVALLDILWHFSSCLRVSNFFFSFCYIIHSYAHGSLLRVHISTSSIYSLSHLFQRSIHQTLHQNDKIPCVRSFIRFETSTGNREKLPDF